MRSFDANEDRKCELRIELLSSSLFLKIQNGGVLHDITSLLAIPFRVKALGSYEDIACSYIENSGGTIRSCLVNNTGVLAILVLYNIDFDAGICLLSYGCTSEIGELFIESAINSLLNWANRIGLSISNMQRFGTLHNNQLFDISVELPGYCMDRIIVEKEKCAIIKYFDKYMFSPLSKNPHGDDSICKMIAASEIVFAYNKKPLGFVSFYANNMTERIAYISSIVVTGESRGIGVGSSLIRQCKMISKEHGMRRIVLRVDKNNDRAIEFYKKHHFHNNEIESEQEFIMSADL